MDGWAAALIKVGLPLVVSLLAPLVTALATRLSGNTLPRDTKPLLNGGAGIALAGAVSDPMTAMIVGPIGAALGNRIREARNTRLAAH